MEELTFLGELSHNNRKGTTLYNWNIILIINPIGWLAMLIINNNINDFNCIHFQVNSSSLQVVPYFYKISMGKKRGEDVSTAEAEFTEKLVQLNEVGEFYLFFYTLSKYTL